MAVEFSRSGTIYDAPPAHTEIFGVGSADLNVPLGGGFQAAHIWVNNRSNQSLYLPDAPDVVPPGVTRVLAILNTDVARASWTVPSQFGVTQFGAPTGAAVIIWLNAGIDISPTPGVANNPNVQSPQKSLGTLVVPGNGNKSATYSVPEGTHSIGVLVQTGALSALKISGGQSGGPYLSLPPAGVTGAALQGPFISAFFSGIDSSVNIFAAAGAAGATVEVVAILSPQAQFVFDNVSESTAVGLVGGAGTALGDTSAPSLAADSVSETISASGLALNELSMVLASFKAAAGQKIAQVGMLGAFLKGTSTAVNPLFGQATTAGNFLVAVVSGSTSNSNTNAAGWALVKRTNTNGQDVEIWTKPNCGANEVAPQFTGGAAGAPCMYGQLAEFSGVATAAPTDQTGSTSVDNPPATNTVTNGSVDAQSGDLVILGTRYATTQGAPAAATYSDTFNNNAVAISMGNNGNGDVSSCAAGLVRYVNHTYAIVPVIAAALPLGTQQWPSDSTATATPATGSVATVTLAANANKAYTVHAYSGEMAQTGATADAGQALALTMGSAIQQHRMGVAAGAGNFAQKDRTGLAFKGAVNQGVTVAFGGAGATTSESVNVAAYLR